MERNINKNHASRVHPSAMLIKVLMNDLNSRPDLTEIPTAIAAFAGYITEFEVVQKPHRLSSYGFNAISMKKVRIEEECSICKENLPDFAVHLPCDHCFHEPCIHEWFLSHSTCPICRTNIDYY